MSSKWTSAFALIGVLIVFGAAGVVALDAQYDSTTQTRADSNDIQDASPAVVDAGLQLSTTLARLVPYLGWIGVPLGILGILTIGGALGKATIGGNTGMHR